MRPTDTISETLQGFVNNQKADIYRKGGNVPGYTPPKSAGDTLRAKGVGGAKPKTQDKSPRKKGESYADYLRRTK